MRRLLVLVALLVAGCAGNLQAIDPYHDAWERDAQSCAAISDPMTYAQCRAAVDLKWAPCFTRWVAEGDLTLCPEPSS